MSNQPPLPGMEEFIEQETKLPAVLLLYMAHLVLRDDVKTIFDHEILALRAMGQLSEKDCASEIYLAQRKLCMALKEVVMVLDEIQDVTERYGNSNG